MTNISSIMTRDPAAAGLNATVEQVIALMVARNVGSIVVVDTDNIPNGIITERELLREISDHSRINNSVESKEIMSLGFIRINPTTTVQEAAKTMARGAVRVVVTKKSGVLMGIVTTSDVLRFFNKTSRDFAIEDCINRKVVTIDASRGMLDAIKVMNEKRIGCLIVTENGLPSGIVSERDLIRVMARGRRKEFGSLRLREIASKPLISAAYGIKAREASSIMLGSKIKRLPLFMGDKLIGIVTAKDLVRAYVDNVLGSRRKREIVNIT